MINNLRQTPDTGAVADLNHFIRSKLMNCDTMETDKFTTG